MLSPHAKAGAPSFSRSLREGGVFSWDRAVDAESQTQPRRLTLCARNALSSEIRSRPRNDLLYSIRGDVLYGCHINTLSKESLVGFICYPLSSDHAHKKCSSHGGESQMDQSICVRNI